MSGVEEKLGRDVYIADESEGIIPRAFRSMWDMMMKRNEQFYVKASFMEIYNEQVRDILNPPSGILHTRWNVKNVNNHLSAALWGIIMRLGIFRRRLDGRRVQKYWGFGRCASRRNEKQAEGLTSAEPRFQQKSFYSHCVSHQRGNSWGCASHSLPILAYLGRSRRPNVKKIRKDIICRSGRKRETQRDEIPRKGRAHDQRNRKH